LWSGLALHTQQPAAHVQRLAVQRFGRREISLLAQQVREVVEGFGDGRVLLAEHRPSHH
jgi:hypothetical protein